MPKYCPIAKTACPNSSRFAAGLDLETHAIFSSGAYSTISLRSVPSAAKRTVTTPPGWISGDDALAERAVPDRVARRERDTRSRLDRSGGGRAVPAPRRGPQALALDLLRQLVEEARGEVVLAPAEERARERVGQREPLHRARHADVAEAPLLLDALLLDRARVREDPLLHPDHEDRAELEALRVVERHQGDEAALVADRVLVGDERDVLQEAGERRLLGLLPVLARDADELLEVLDPPARLDRPLGLEGVERARLLEDALEELVGVELLRERHERLHRRVEAADRAARCGGDAGRLGIGHRLEERAAGVLRVRDEALQRRVADPAPRAVRDAEERGRVLRVHEHGEIRRRVADLRALVEARAADDLVRHVLAHEHVLQHTRLRVHPVEDRDLARRVAVRR